MEYEKDTATHLGDGVKVDAGGETHDEGSCKDVAEAVGLACSLETFGDAVSSWVVGCVCGSRRHGGASGRTVRAGVAASLGRVESWRHDRASGGA